MMNKLDQTSFHNFNFIKLTIPINTPNHKVENLLIMVVATAKSLLIPINTRKPIKEPSTAIKPPGIIDKAPSMNEKDTMNTDAKMEILLPKDFIVKYITTPSKNQDTIPIKIELNKILPFSIILILL